MYVSVSGIELAKYFSFYEWTNRYNDIQLEGVIDWESASTTISMGESGMDVWLDEDKIVDTMIDYELRRGLGLLTDTLSAFTSGVQ